MQVERDVCRQCVAGILQRVVAVDQPVDNAAGITVDPDKAALWVDDICMLEALKDGVRLRRLSDTLNVDFFVVLRPQLPPNTIRQAIERGVVHEGKMYNFDFDFRNLTGNQSMAIFFDDESDREAKWHWVIPDAVYSTSGEGGNVRSLLAATFIDTNWADDDGDGVDDYPGSSLDYIFVAQGARDWRARSSVVVREGDFPDDEATSDHRPVEAVFSPM